MIGVRSVSAGVAASVVFALAASAGPALGSTPGWNAFEPTTGVQVYGHVPRAELETATITRVQIFSSRIGYTTFRWYLEALPQDQPSGWVENFHIDGDVHPFPSPGGGVNYVSVWRRGTGAWGSSVRGYHARAICTAHDVSVQPNYAAAWVQLVVPDGCVSPLTQYPAPGSSVFSDARGAAGPVVVDNDPHPTPWTPAIGTAAP